MKRSEEEGYIERHKLLAAPLSWRDVFIREYAGHPFQVATNTLALACVGIFVGHWLLQVPFSDRLAMAAMTPGLIAIIAAAILKKQHPQKDR